MPEGSALELPRRFNSMLRQQVAHEGFMRFRDALRQRAHGHTLFFLDRHVLRNEHIDPVRLAIDVVVDPLQFKLKLIRCKRSRTKDAKAAGTTHRGDHVTAVTKSHQRKIYIEHFTERSFHESPQGREKSMSGCSFLASFAALRQILACRSPRRT